MKKTILSLALLLLTVGMTVAVWMRYRSVPFSSQPRVYHIGIMARGRGSYEVAIQGFQDRLRELGYVDGQNVIYDVRYLSTKDELAQAAQYFLNEHVDLIITYSTPATEAAYRATQKMQNPIPIVFGSVANPVAAGFIKSIEQTNSNVTGVISLSSQLTSKRIELLLRAVPGIKKIAMPRSAEELNDISANRSVALAEQTAKDMGVQLVLFPVHTQEENSLIAAKITAKVVQGMIVGADSLVWSGLDNYIKQAIKQKIAFSAFDIDQVKRGALIGFGPDYIIMGQQVAGLSHQILQGKRPQDIPVEIPKKLILAINLDTARAIGLSLDPQLLKEADVIIGQ